MVNILLLLICAGILANIFVESFDISPSYAYFGTLLVTLYICVANFIVSQGYNRLGTRLLRFISLFFLMLAVFNLFIVSYEKPYLDIIFFVFSGLGLWVTFSIQFQIFVLHRKKMMDCGRERMKKNKAFMDKIKESHTRAEQ